MRKSDKLSEFSKKKPELYIAIRKLITCAKSMLKNLAGVIIILTFPAALLDNTILWMSSAATGLVVDLTST
jgi:hypothetical protein